MALIRLINFHKS